MSGAPNSTSVDFNGAFLSERPLPAFPWLLPSWAEHHSAVGTIPDALPQIEALVTNGLVTLEKVRVALSRPLPL